MSHICLADKLVSPIQLFRYLPATMRRLTLIFFLLYLAALTWPGYLPFNRVDPPILGLPFSFAWVVLWVILGWVMLACLYLADRRARRE